MRCRVAAVLVLACAFAAAPAAAQAAVPSGFFGMYAWDYPSDEEMARMGQGGVGTFRTTLTWRVVEQTRGARDWTVYDFLMARAAREGVNVLPVVIGSPSYVSRRDTYPPRTRSEMRAYARFLRDAVRRYGRGGEFWKGQPDLRPRPIRAWQIWNENNIPVYSGGRPSARRYAALLRTSRRVIKREDRRAKVVLGGLPESRLGIPMARFLEQLYRRGGRRLFDVVAIHPYARGAAGVKGALIRARRVMNRNRDRRKRIWLTELGWATGGPSGAFTTSQAGQAARLRSTFRLLMRTRSRFKVDVAVWFSLRDRPLGAGERDWWAPHTGLFEASGQPKRAWSVFTALSRGSAGSGPLHPR